MNGTIRGRSGSTLEVVGAHTDGDSGGHVDAGTVLKQLPSDRRLGNLVPWKLSTGVESPPYVCKEIVKVGRGRGSCEAHRIFRHLHSSGQIVSENISSICSKQMQQAIASHKQATL